MVKEAKVAKGLALELDAANWTWLSEKRLLLALKTGQLIVVVLTLSAGVVSEIQVCLCWVLQACFVGKAPEGCCQPKNLKAELLSA